jgi:hypothetical protein
LVEEEPNRKSMTLSDFWGKADVLKLTESRRIEFQNSIPYQSLPKTFQDTIYVTKALGIDYLRIDSHYIIQDSREDWKREAANMGQVYPNSYCNIAATGASDGTQGQFFERNLENIEAAEVYVDWNSDCSRWYALTQEEAIHDKVGQDIIGEPLNDRG